jgi:XTP/dITP diphosphohydrolase
MITKTIIIATKNPGKIREIKHVLSPLKFVILSLLDFRGIPEIREDGRTFKENAVKKASTIAKKLKIITLADDSGLEVMALGGKPGIRSARYAGPNPTSKKLCTKLLKALGNKNDRRARFVCNIAIADEKGNIKVVEGVCKGRITHKTLGAKGFGYDPIFIPDGYRKTFAQMPMKLKNSISHRGKALQIAKKSIQKIL